MAVLALFGVRVALPAQSAASVSLTIWVAPEGDDRWSGRLREPNASRTDGPLASVEAARDALRWLRSRTADRPGAEVRIREGTYRLARTLVLEPQDGGAPGAPVVYRGDDAAKPVLSGGERLSGFRVGEDGRWRLVVPDVAAGGPRFGQLFVDGERMPRPRVPAMGYSRIEATEWPTEAARGRGYDRFRFHEGDLRADWHRVEDVEVLAFHNWSMSRLRIASIDEPSRTVTFTAPTCSAEQWAAMPKGNRFLAENVREALGRPGEWYLDGGDGTLTYCPRSFDDPERSEVVAPRLETILDLRGDVERREWVSHVTFEGIAFAHSGWTVPPEGSSESQSEISLPAAVNAVGARDCAFVGCEVSGTGAWAIELGAGCRRNRVERCVLRDLGAGGVKLGRVRRSEDPESVASHQVVRDCLVAHGGRVHPAGCGVWIGDSPDNVVEHLDIVDFYYTGISVGWTYGYAPSRAHRNRIASNHIREIGQGVLSDMGGVYTLGSSPGTEIRGNLVHDVQCFAYGGWGIYADEGTSQLRIEDNVVHHVETAGYHQHYGREVLVRNNVFAFGGKAQVMLSRAEPHLSFTFERNVVLWSDGTLLGGGGWTGARTVFRDNLYWNMRARPVSFAGASFVAWRGKGQDLRSRFASPRFFDALRGDFRMRDGSPAFELGFERIDTSTAGRLTKSPAVGSLPSAFPLTR